MYAALARRSCSYFASYYLLDHTYIIECGLAVTHVYTRLAFGCTQVAQLDLESGLCVEFAASTEEAPSNWSLQLATSVSPQVLQGTLTGGLRGRYSHNAVFE